MGVPTPFAGSAVVSADQPVAAIVNLVSSGPVTQESYDGMNNPATTVNVPLFQQGNHGTDTTLHIQNTTGSPTTVTVASRGPGAPATAPTFNLAANASVAVDGTNDQITVPTFVGSVVVSATQPIAVEVNQSSGTILFADTGAVGGSTVVYAPLLMTNNHGMSTGLQVQNTGDTPTTMSLFLDGSSTPAAVSGLIQPGASQNWYPIPTTNAGPAYVGSGKVTTNNGMTMLGIVNELNTVSGQGMAYSTFGAGTQSVQMPLLQYNNHGIYTGEQIQNVGDASATVDLIVNGNIVDTKTLAAGKSFTWYDVKNPVIYGNSTVSSAVAMGHSPTDQLVGVVNQITDPYVTGSGDTSSVYEGFNGSTP